MLTKVDLPGSCRKASFFFTILIRIEDRWTLVGRASLLGFLAAHTSRQPMRAWEGDFSLGGSPQKKFSLLLPDQSSLFWLIQYSFLTSFNYSPRLSSSQELAHAADIYCVLEFPTWLLSLPATQLLPASTTSLSALIQNNSSNNSKQCLLLHLLWFSAFTGSR